MEHKERAEAIYRIIGPKDNIIEPYNCMTRLRFRVKEESFTTKELEMIDGVKVINKSGDEWQLIFGPGTAAKVTAELKALLAAIPAKEATSPAADAAKSTPSVAALAGRAGFGNGKELHEAIRRRNSTPGRDVLKKISHIFVPIIPAFIACGLITGLVNIFVKADPSLTTYPTVQLLAIAGNAAFWGLNLFVGVQAADEFGGTPILGGVMAAVISHPGLSSVTLFDTSLMPGRGGIIAVLLIAFFAATLEKRLHRIVPDMFDLFLTPLLVVVISTAVAIGICQPAGAVLSEAIGTAATTAIDSGGAVTGFVLGGTFLPMVMVGIHQGLTPIHAELLNRYGVTILLPVLAMAGAGQVGAAFAVYGKTKNNTLKKTILSALPVGFMGIGEPLIYGVTLPLGKPFIGACIGGAFGGAVQAAYGIGAAAIGISGLPLAAATTNLSVYVAGLLTAYATGFVATWLIGFTDPPESEV